MQNLWPWRRGTEVTWLAQGPRGTRAEGETRGRTRLGGSRWLWKDATAGADVTKAEVA